MAFTYRDTKGSRLTSAEGDANFREVETKYLKKEEAAETYALAGAASDPIAQPVISSGPTNEDTLYFFEADNPAGFAKNKAIGKPDMLVSLSGAGDNFDVRPNQLNSLPAVYSNNSYALGNLTASGRIYPGETYDTRGQGTLTILTKYTGTTANDWWDKWPIFYEGQDFLCFGHSTLWINGASAGSGVPISAGFNIITLHFEYNQTAIFVNGIFLKMVSVGDTIRASLFHNIQLLGGWQGYTAAVIISRDSSRNAGRRQEQYLKTKYAV